MNRTQKPRRETYFTTPAGHISPFGKSGRRSPVITLVRDSPGSGNVRESRSGTGSTVDNTVSIRKTLTETIGKYNVRKMLDLGCGDWNWLKEIPKSRLPAKYIGIDAAPDVIASNQAKHGDKQVKFVCESSLDYLAERSYKEFDLILIRHSLEHLPNDYNIQLLKEVIRCAKYVLITSAKHDQANVNGKCKVGGYRPINLLMPPYIKVIGHPSQEIDDYCDGEKPGITFINFYEF
jgi:SAM-dependent methyltransferase